MQNNKKNLIDLAIFIIMMYLVSSLTLIFVYDGGSLINPTKTSFCLNTNHLSDLGRAYYFNGNINPFSFFYNSSLVFLGIYVALFFYLVSSVIKQRKINKIIISLGVISGISTMFIGWLPSDLFLKQHVFSAKFAFYSFYLTSILLIIFIDKNKYKTIFYMMSILTLLFISRTFLVYWAKQADLSVETLLHIRTISEKFVIYPQMIFSLIIMFYIRKQTPHQL